MNFRMRGQDFRQKATCSLSCVHHRFFSFKTDENAHFFDVAERIGQQSKPAASEISRQNVKITSCWKRAFKALQQGIIVFIGEKLGICPHSIHPTPKNCIGKHHIVILYPHNKIPPLNPAFCQLYLCFPTSTIFGIPVLPLQEGFVESNEAGIKFKLHFSLHAPQHAIDIPVQAYSRLTGRQSQLSVHIRRCSHHKTA